MRKYKNRAAVSLGRKGGCATSDAKTQAARENGKKGGRPKGRKNDATLEKEAVLAAFKEKTMKAADILFTSQLHLAKGQTFLYKIEKELQIGPKGGKKYVRSKPILVTDQAEIEAYLQNEIVEGDVEDENDPEATYYFLTTKEPDNKAADSLLDRTFGKSAQVIEADITSKGERINLDDNQFGQIIRSAAKRGSSDKGSS